MHPYCSRTCANLARDQASATPIPSPNPSNIPNPSNTVTPVNGTVASTNTGNGSGPTNLNTAYWTTPRDPTPQGRGRTPQVLTSPAPTPRVLTSPVPASQVLTSPVPTSLRHTPSGLTPLGYTPPGPTLRGHTPPAPTPLGPTPSGPTCQTSGCSSPVFVDPNGVASNYCAGKHQECVSHLSTLSREPILMAHRWGERGCVFCREAPMDSGIIFCDLCHNKVLHMAPMIVEVPSDHESYISVASQFRQKWTHNTRCPQVRAVYKIVSPTANLVKYEQYLLVAFVNGRSFILTDGGGRRDRVEAAGDFASQGRSRGNVNRRWHGTTRKCRIGDKGMTTLCPNPSCSLCRIIANSFDLSFFAKKTNWGRFGVGIYTSSTSSKYVPVFFNRVGSAV